MHTYSEQTYKLNVWICGIRTDFSLHTLFAEMAPCTGPLRVKITEFLTSFELARWFFCLNGLMKPLHWPLHPLVTIL